jgi:hypothetical protein
MTAEQWCEGLNRLKIDRVKMVPVTLCGGEPTVHREWSEIISGIKDDFYLDILTNCTFDLDEFMMAAPPSRWERDVPYPAIRISYHPEFSRFDWLLDRAQRLDIWGYPIGIFVVTHPTVSVKPLAAKAKAAGIDFRTKEFLGRHDGKLYGEYKYPEAVKGERIGAKVKCRTHELLIAPDGHIHRCHRDLYAGENPVGHILDDALQAEFLFRDCSEMGTCSECDVKIKNNRFQVMGACSVEIDGL